MTARSGAYRASHIKRHRATKAEVETRRETLFNIVEAMRPMTVRQVFYQATVCGVVEKSEAGYTKVQTDLVQMRRSGELPYGWLADSTRWQRKPRSFDGIKEALQHTAEFYRKDLWHSADTYAEIWLEKDALSGVVFPVTAEYDVPLMVARGYASLSFLHGAAEIYFERLAVTTEQIEDWALPTRPTKASDTRSRGFGAISVELDAIPPDHLRAIVRAAIEQHLPPKQFKVLKAAEESERRAIAAFVGAGGEP